MEGSRAADVGRLERGIREQRVLENGWFSDEAIDVIFDRPFHLFLLVSANGVPVLTKHASKNVFTKWRGKTFYLLHASFLL